MHRLRSDCADGNTRSENGCLEEAVPAASHSTQEPKEELLAGRQASQSFLTQAWLCHRDPRLSGQPGGSYDYMRINFLFYLDSKSLILIFYFTIVPL